MPGSIIVALDGSSTAEAALEPGLALATGFGAELVLFRATFHDPATEEERYLEDLADKLGYARTQQVTSHGFADSGVHDLASTLDRPVLCLTTRGRSGAGAILGSVARDLVARVHTTTVLVGPEYLGTALGEGHAEVLVWCWDGSPGAERMEATVIEWAAALHLRVEIATVLHRHGTYLGDLPADNARGGALAAVERLRAAGITCDPVELNGLDVARAITDHAHVIRPAVVAAGATARGESQGAARLARTVLGTTAQRIVRHSPAPVLLGHP